MSKQLISVLVTDLDNTLFDWFEFWYRSFSAMLDRIAKDSGIAKEVLISEIKLIHERHQTSEYAFSIQELPSLQEKHPNKDLAETYNDAILQMALKIETSGHRFHLFTGGEQVSAVNTDRRLAGCSALGWFYRAAPRGAGHG